MPLPSCLNIPVWRHILSDYHDKTLVDFLEFGWPADYTALQPPTSATSNHHEVLDYTDQIRSYVEEEMAYGAIIGPFEQPPSAPWTQISPMMTRPKRNSNKRRVIVDLSYHGRASVNA